jgi:hypothetical protein
MGCDACGWEPQRRGSGIDFADGDLIAIDSPTSSNAPASQMERARFYSELLHHQEARGYKSGWAAHKFKDKFGSFPPWAWNDLHHRAITDHRALDQVAQYRLCQGLRARRART